MGVKDFFIKPDGSKLFDYLSVLAPAQHIDRLIDHSVIVIKVSNLALLSISIYSET